MHQQPGVVLLIATLLWAGPAAAQALVPSRDVRPATSEVPDGTASIAGSVVVAGSGQPARKARVTVSGGEPRVSISRTTDDRGAFSFTSLPAGRYSLTVSKPGHVPVTYGQHRPGSGRPGTPIQLADGQRFEARLQLPRGGALTGSIVDENAEPSQGIPVRALRYAYQNGVRTLQSAAMVTTDDRGIFRLFGLQPGDYVICATPRNPSATDAERMPAEVEALQRAAEAAAARNAPDARGMLERALTMRGRMAVMQDEAPAGYAPVCFPGATMPSAAAAVTLGAGEERGGLDFQLQLTPLGQVEGTLLNTPGGSTRGVQITLSPSGESAATETRSARPDADGRFRFPGVPPGQYTIVARGTVPSQPPPAARSAAERAESAALAARQADHGRFWAMADVVVDGRSPSSVVLTLQPGTTISGQMVFEGTQQPPADLSRLRVTAMGQAMPGLPRELAGAVTGRVDANGRFTITGVMPGQYRLTANAPGWFLESATIAGQDAADLPVEIRPGQNVTGATITLTDRHTEFSGTAFDERNEPVSAYTILLFPADPRHWAAQSRRIQVARPGTDGRFTFRNLPPGDYRLATLFDPEPGSWYDPSLLQQLQGSSTPVRFTPGEKKRQDVRIGSTQ